MFDIGQAVIDGLRPIFELFKDETVAPNIALWLVVLAAACIACFLLGHVLPLSCRLTSRTNAVRRSGDKHGFAQDFQRIDNLLRQDRCLAHAWLAFRDGLIEPDPDDPRPVVRNTVRPGIYLNLPDLGLHFRGFHALPNVFVGLGLLFTFIGLVAALHFAAQGVGAADLNRTQLALTDLLHAATFKFYTSIAGLASSIAFGFVLRAGIGHLERRLDTLCAALEERMVLTTAESIALRHYREAQAQTEQLKVFNTDLAMTLGRQLEAALDKILPQHLAPAAETVGQHLATLPGHLQEAVKPVVNRLDRVTADLAKQASVNIGDMAKEFHANLQGATGDQMRMLSEIVEKLARTLEGAGGQIETSGDRLLIQVQTASNELAATATAIGEAVRGLSAQVRNDAAAQATIRDGQVGVLQKAMAEMARHVTETMVDAERRVRGGAETAAGEMARRLAEAATALERSALSIGTAIEDATRGLAHSGSRAGDAVREKGQEVADALAAAGAAAAEDADRRLRAATEAMAAELRGVSADIANSVHNLVEKIQATATAVTTVNAHLDDHCRTLDGATGRAHATAMAFDANAASLNKAAAPFLQVGQMIAASVDGLARSSVAAAATLKDAQQQTEVLARNLAETLDELQTVWGQHAARFDHADEELGKAFEKMLDGARGNAQAIRDFVKEIDDKLGESVEHLGGAVEELKEFGEEIHSATDRLVRTSLQAA